MTGQAASPRARSTGLDAMRLLAAVFVVYIHLDIAENALGNAEFAIKTFCRWAVPIFFMLSGYFLPSQNGWPRIDGKRLRKVLVIIVTANLLYLPLVPFVRAEKSFPGMLVNGVWFHLWFLSALLVGLALLKLVSGLPRPRILLAVITVAVLAGYHVADYANIISQGGYDGTLKFFRFLQAAPMLWLGWELAQRECGKDETGLALILLVAGLALCLGEILWFMGTGGLPSTTAQFPVGVLPMTFGIFLLFRTQAANRLAGMAALGAAYSLLIYVLHPLALLATVRLLRRLHLGEAGVLAGEIVLVPVLALLLAMAIRRFVPPLAAALQGELPGRR